MTWLEVEREFEERFKGTTFTPAQCNAMYVVFAFLRQNYKPPEKQEEKPK